MRLFASWSRIAVAVAVLALTIALPSGVASAAAGDVWFDASYGTQGVAAMPDGCDFGQTAVDSADRLYATCVGPTSELRRFTPGGAPDSTFGGGIVAVPGYTGAIQADAGGTVTVVTTAGAGNGAVVRRFTQAGDPTPGFGVGGAVAILATVETPILIGTVARAGGGVIVLVSAYAAGFVKTAYLVALTSTGALDSSWNPAGSQPGVLVLTTDAQAVAADGNAVMLLAYVDGTQGYPYLLRLSSAGVPDPAFGTGGTFTLPSPGQFSPAGLAVFGGASFVAGSIQAGGQAMAVAKVRSTGSLDPDFGTAGIAIGHPDPCQPSGVTVAVTAQHVFVAGGFANGGCQMQLPIVDRFTPAGRADTGFGTAGELRIESIAGEPTGGVVFNLQSSGRPVVVVGTVTGRVFSVRLLDTAVPPAAGSFVPLTPVRLLDTRNGNGAPAGSIPGGGSLDLQVTGRGGVPSAGVGAVVLNVTVTQPASDGNIVVFPTGTAMPLASNVNFGPGQTVPNLVTVKVGAGGKVTLRNNSTGTVQLVADVAGYYRGGTATQPGTFTALAPSRILDTRTGNGAPAAAVAGGGSIDLQVTGRGGVPSSNVAAVVLTVTVTQPSWNGNVAVYPTGEAAATSNLNFGPGQTAANLVTVKVGDGGKVTLKNNSTGTVQLVADMAGYYLAGIATVPGAFVPVSPSRFLDTRNGTGVATAGPVAAGHAVDLGVTTVGAGGLPGAAVVLNVTVTQPTWDGTVVAYPTGSAAPLASNVNFVSGQTVPNLAIVKIGAAGQVTLRNNSTQGTLHLVADVYGYFLN